MLELVKDFTAKKKKPTLFLKGCIWQTEHWIIETQKEYASEYCKSQSDAQHSCGMTSVQMLSDKKIWRQTLFALKFMPSTTTVHNSGRQKQGITDARHPLHIRKKKTDKTDLCSWLFAMSWYYHSNGQDCPHTEHGGRSGWSVATSVPSSNFDFSNGRKQHLPGLDCIILDWRPPGVKRVWGQD